MNPDDLVAALGYLCGAGFIYVRHGEDWSEIRATAALLDSGDADTVITTTNLFRILGADEVKF